MCHKIYPILHQPEKCGAFKMCFQVRTLKVQQQHKICLFGFDRTPNQPLLQEKLV